MRKRAVKRSDPVDLSIVIAVFHDEGNLQELHRRLRPPLDSLTGKKTEIILVDDGSADKSWDVIKELKKSDPSIRGFRFSRNFGQHMAISAGLRKARGKFVLVMDSDLEEPPEKIPVFFEKIQAGRSDMIIGLRIGHPMGFWRGFLSDLYVKFFHFFVPVKIHSQATNFRIMTRKVARVVAGFREKDKFLGGLMAWSGFETGYEEVETGKRFSGSSNYNLSRLVQHAFNGILSFSVLPLRIAILIGFLSSFTSFWFAAFILVRRLLYPDIPLGYSSIFVSVTFMGGMILFCLGIVGEYIGRIFEEVKRRPEFIIKEIV